MHLKTAKTAVTTFLSLLVLVAATQDNEKSALEARNPIAHGKPRYVVYLVQQD